MAKKEVLSPDFSQLPANTCKKACVSSSNDVTNGIEQKQSQHGLFSGRSQFGIPDHRVG
jgi:hypothetical protein